MIGYTQENLKAPTRDHNSFCFSKALQDENIRIGNPTKVVEDSKTPVHCSRSSNKSTSVQSDTQFQAIQAAYIWQRRLRGFKIAK